MANCTEGCGRDIKLGNFIYMGIDFPLFDEGDLVSAEIEETEFNEHTDHRGNNLVYSVKGSTKVTITVMMNPCTAEYNELYQMWRCNKRICGEASSFMPCCGIATWDAVRVQKMGFPKLSHDNAAIEVVFVGYLPTC